MVRRAAAGRGEDDAASRPLDESALRATYPRAYQYLRASRDRLSRRRGVPASAWFAFRSAGLLSARPGPRLLLKRIFSGGDFTADERGDILCHGTLLLVQATRDDIDPRWLLGVLNSRVFREYARSVLPTIGDGRHAIRLSSLRQFPIPLGQGLGANPLQIEIGNAVGRLLEDVLAPEERRRLIERIEELVSELYEVDQDEVIPSMAKSVSSKPAVP